ncbi:MAG: hypothetical protein ABRQ39_07610 [Candidatus Eremiobacterota bacterium]
MSKYSFIFLTGLILFILFAGCGGGGGSTVNVITQTATPVPTQVPTGSVSGKVFESDGITPIANAFVALYTSSFPRTELSAQATPYRTMTTASDGSYLFTDIPQGNAYIAMWRNESEYNTNPNNPTGANNVTIVNVNIIIIIINNIVPTPVPTSVPTSPSGSTPTPTTPPANTPTPTNTPGGSAPTATNTPGGSAPTATNTPGGGPTPVAGGLVGIVYNLFTNAPVEGVNLAVQGKTGTTDVNGHYTIESAGTGTQRLTITGGNIITRSLPVNLTGGYQDIRVLPSTFNTTMFRALTVWPGSHTGTARWEVKPKFIIYKYMQDVDNVAVPQATIDNITSVVQEIGGLADGFFSSPQIEYYNGRVNDDPRWQFSSGTPQWGYIKAGYNAIGISMIQSLGSNTGFGGGTWDGDLWLRGGGLVLSAEYQSESYFPSTVRHEMGHALALWHPFENLDVNNAQMEYSVMNYWPQGSLYGKRTDGFSDADRNAFIIMYHRAPDNNAPDMDPDNYSGYHRKPDILHEFVSE